MAVRDQMRRIRSRLLGLVGLAPVAKVAVPNLRHATVQVGEDAVPQPQPYGFISRAKPGAEALLVDLGGSADATIAIMVADRRYVIALAEGEVAMSDDLGQKVHLTRSGVSVTSGAVVNVNAPTINLTATEKVTLADTGGAAVARTGDTVGSAASMAAWLIAATAAINAGTPPIIPLVAPLDFGVITGGSTKVTAS